MTELMAGPAATADVPGLAAHRSAVTGLDWRAVDSLYYDCHVVSLTQLLPPRLLAAFLLVAGAPTIRADWGSVSCRNLLDSETARDELLMGEWGVEKYHRPVEGDIESTLRDTVRAHGHCVARVDSYYHEHFSEYYLTEHRTNGHKVTVVDFDDTSYTGIDNVGTRTLFLRFDRELFTESIRSNLVHVYDKHDSLYRLHVGDRARRALADGTVLERERAAVAGLLTERDRVGDELARYRQEFASALAAGGIRRHAQLNNSYHCALMVERAHTAITEAHLRSREPWRDLPDAGAAYIETLRRAIKGWRTLKMLCRAALTGGTVGDRSLLAAFDRMRDAETSGPRP